MRMSAEDSRFKGSIQQIWISGHKIRGGPPSSINKAVQISSAFQTQWRRHQKSKPGVSMTPQKGLMFSKKFKNGKVSTNCGRT